MYPSSSTTTTSPTTATATPAAAGLSSRHPAHGNLSSTFASATTTSVPTSSVPRPIRTRRQLWLAANPSYFTQTGHALALPLAHEQLVRRYRFKNLQTANPVTAERASNGNDDEKAGLKGQRQHVLNQSSSTTDTSDTAHIRGRVGTATAGYGRPKRQAETASTSSSTPKAALQPETRSDSRPKSKLKALPEEMMIDVSPKPDGTDDVGNADSRNINTPQRDDIRGKEADALKRSGTLLQESRLQEETKWDLAHGLVPDAELFSNADGDNAFDDDTLLFTGHTMLDNSKEAAQPSGRNSPLDEATALGRWRALLTARFIAGDDDDFDYGPVDGDDTLDQDWAEARLQEDWFENESEAWIGEDAGDLDESTTSPRHGETGIQDF